MRVAGLRHWGVSSKIAAGFAAVLSIFLLVVVAAGAGLWKADSSFGVYRRLAGSAQETGVVQDLVLRLRLGIAEYAEFRSDDAARDGVLHTADEVLGLLDRNAAGAIGADAATANDVRAQIQRLRKAFEALIDAASALRRLRSESLDATAVALDKEATDLLAVLAASADVKQQLMASDLGHEILDARFNAYRFLQSLAAADREAVEGNLAKAKSGLAALGNEPSVRPFKGQLQKIAQEIDDYAKIFGDASALALKLQQLRHDVLIPAGTAVVAALDQTTAKARATEEQLGEDAQRAIALTGFGVAALTALGLILAAGVSLVIGRAIARPIAAVTHAMRCLAAGDLSVAVPGKDRRDEVGQMVGAVEVFRENAVEMDRLRRAREEDQERAQAQRRQEVLELADQLDAAIKDVARAVAEAARDVERNVQTVAASLDQTGRQACAVVAASGQASESVQGVAGAAEELSVSISEIRSQVSRVAGMASTAAQTTRRTDGTVQSLAQAAEKIGEVINLINDIAGQTNLLALNATIEAARAGEAGKGFAVVASEVKALANQTGRATEDIRTQIAAMRAATDDAVQAIREIGGTVGEMDSIAGTVASMVDQQSAATQEIASRAGAVAARTQDVTQNISGVSDAANASSGAAAEVLALTKILADQSSRLQSSLDRFTARIRA